MRRLDFARRSLRLRSLSYSQFSQAIIIAAAADVEQAARGPNVSEQFRQGFRYNRSTSPLRAGHAAHAPVNHTLQFVNIGNSMHSCRILV